MHFIVHFDLILTYTLISALMYFDKNIDDSTSLLLLITPDISVLILSCY